MNYFDLHGDTLSRLYFNLYGETGDLYKNNCHIDITRLLSNGYTAQVFAGFLDINYPHISSSHYEDICLMYDMLDKTIEAYPHQIAKATDYTSYINNKEKSLLSAFISLEEAGVLVDKAEDIKTLMDRLTHLHSRGLRFINLTWNNENHLAYPNINSEFRAKGLKKLGFSLVEAMDSLGIVADVSHLSDGGFWDIINHSKRPPIATHSNARAIVDHPRNLDDKMIKALGNKGGIMGLNFCLPFVHPTKDCCEIEDLITHCKHIINVGGREVLALGADFDGIGNKLEVDGVGEINKLSEGLEKAGFSYDVIENICYKNCEEFLRRV